MYLLKIKLFMIILPRNLNIFTFTTNPRKKSSSSNFEKAFYKVEYNALDDETYCFWKKVDPLDQKHPLQHNHILLLDDVIGKNIHGKGS
jgi:hypothetical protein